ncbi:MAG: translation elongation factor 4 [Planctomycetota bacterium]|nr:translation elongation factor 4 [Planctomycetota bacterium]
MIGHIRNFCIVAHIDHGKSTLADRLLELTDTVSQRKIREQFLDSNELERERGITIKAKAVAMDWKGYQLNLIDTPGHVDFTYEVSRSLAACEGAVLLVDCTQGVQAQTVANTLLALENNLEIVPALNKIDLPTAQIDESIEEMESSLGVKAEEILQVSGKTGMGAEELLAHVIKTVPAPDGDPKGPLRAMIFDSEYDDYRGVIVYIRLIDGTLKKGDKIRFVGTDREAEIEEVGVFRPEPEKMKSLTAGQVGYVMANIRSIRDIQIGDTIVEKENVDAEALPGYKEPVPMVYCGFYPTGDTDYEMLKKALERLSLNDSSFSFQSETSEALGFGYRCGFLGLLHMEIIQERLEREEKVQLIQTAPNVTYEVVTNKGETLRIDNPAKLPDDGLITEWREPLALAKIIIPTEFIGNVMGLCGDRRGEYVRTTYISPIRVILEYHIPFSEIVFDFYDKLKSGTRGYGTLDYTIEKYEPAELCRLRILVGGIEVDALSTIVAREFSARKGRAMLKILRKEIPRQMFEVALQASIGKKVIAREDIRALSKNVTAKCYGGDISRKRKLWEKQKEGKKRMKAVGRVEIPQEAFMAVLKSNEGE